MKGQKKRLSSGVDHSDWRQKMIGAPNSRALYNSDAGADNRELPHPRFA
ncbi:MAG: hypothetical protein M3371_13565 [Acidobacteriota bacterium]|nr:hypothetical protein [Acidobacteriota bacterium]